MGIQVEVCRVLLAHLCVDILLIVRVLRDDGVVGDCTLLALVFSLLQDHHVLF